jgi:hypothetical protein
MEDFQVRHYDETILKAKLTDDIDYFLVYLEEFIKKSAGDRKAEDYYALKELSPEDQRDVLEILQKYGISYERQ